MRPGLSLAKSSFPDGLLQWSSNVELLVSVYPFLTMKSFVLHIVDLDHRGPHYEYQRVKMLTLDEVIAGLLEEEVVVERPDDEESKHQTGPGFEERRRFDAFKRIHMR